MSLVINTNVSALNAQRQLVQSGNDMSTAMERLSSGKRINTAGDDAAGLAISNRMTSQVRGLTQAVRNANDGVSMIQTAEGALDEATTILQRIRELSIQSANGIYDEADRRTLDAEVQQLKEELDRIATSTTFNGQPLLDGSLGEVELQVGSQSRQVIVMSIPSINIKSLGGSPGGDIVGTRMGVAPGAITGITGADPDSSLLINGQSVGDLTSATNMQELLDLFNTNVSGVETTAFNEITAQSVGTGILRGDAMMELTVHQPDGSLNTYQIGDTGSMEELAEKVTKVTGGTITGELDEEGRLVLGNRDGASINVTYSGGASQDNVGIEASASAGIDDAYLASLSFEATDDNGVTIEYGSNVGVNATELGVNARDVAGDITGLFVADGSVSDIDEGDIVINGISIDGITAVAGDAEGTLALLVEKINDTSAEHGVVATVNTAAGGAYLTLNSVSGKEMELSLTGSATLEATGLLNTNVAVTVGDAIADIRIDTAEGAQKAIDVADFALEQINATRSQMGAINNRLDFTISNLANVMENTAAARSRIVDADFAKETSELTRAQVLQQASQAMLAQANAQPQQVLQLLQG